MLFRSQRADTILRFTGKARPVGVDDLRLAKETWRDLAAPTPEAVAERAARPEERWPHLRPALRRFLEELPAPGSGLGRTETTTLQGLAAGPSTATDLFRAVIAGEEAAFMGDLSFFRILDDLASGRVPLVSGMAPLDETANTRDYARARLELTMAGEDVLAGEDDHIALNGIDRWWGGTRLGKAGVWRYDRRRGRLVAPSD